MKRLLFCLCFLLQLSVLWAQKREEGFDYSFSPTTTVPRYYVITEKKDAHWHRQAYYLPERSLALEGTYLDEACTLPHGTVKRYHTDGVLKSTGAYVSGKKEGSWLEYNDKGMVVDSANFAGGRLKGVRLHWYNDGMPSDSMNFDGAGKGVEVSWFENGRPATAGFWVSDTLREGRWKYYHPNGQLLATEDYVSGKRVDWKCFDSTGRALDTAACPEQEADFRGGISAWSRFLSRNLKPDVPIRHKAPDGLYTVVYQFIVDTDGGLKNLQPLTKFGYGMEEEVERILKMSPRWIPAQQFGRAVKAYRKQPITFAVDTR
ncbi:hypothetical protein V9K67_01180 [Paraflavisolibacter sp. H34]|uniref:hypothetical protein n=1 Tax=Huijunlia imazamoxiresistens TaxID=3127457 RepID=UPI0030197A2F